MKYTKDIFDCSTGICKIKCNGSGPRCVKLTIVTTVHFIHHFSGHYESLQKVCIKILK